MNNITRQELQQKLDELFVDMRITYNYDISNKLEKVLAEWFGDTQGYFGVRIDKYDVTITYKSRSVVTFSVRRERSYINGWYCKKIIIEEGFVDTATRIAEIKQDYKRGYENFDREKYKKEEVVQLLRKAKELFPNKTAEQLRSLLCAYQYNFYMYEEAMLQDLDVKEDTSND